MKQLLCLILFGAVSASAFQLGVNYSEWLGFPPDTAIQFAADSSGATYFLTSATQSNVTQSTVMKLTPDGKTVAWQNPLGFAAVAMAVDPAGGVYVVPAYQQSDSTAYVAKLSATGNGIAWKTSIGFVPESIPAIAADSQGRVYLAAQYAVNNYITRSAYVIRLSASGSAIDFTTTISGTPTSVAIDPSGAAYIAGSAVSSAGVGTGFLAKVGSDGSPAYYSVLPVDSSQTVAVNTSGNVWLLGYGGLQRIDSTGAVALTIPIYGYSLALDAAGNAYVGAATNQHQIRNSLATCGFSASATSPNPTSGAQFISVIAPDGSILQGTYIPGGNYYLGSPALAVVPNGTVLVLAAAGPAFTPTQAGPFPAQSIGSSFLADLSPTPPNSSAPTYPLACAVNSASLTVGSVSPGQLMSLYGSGLGPQQGVQAQVAAPSQYPTNLANVQVSFDGIPAPLLWVQDGQINLVAPWSLTPGQNTQICASYNNISTNCLTWPVTQATPAVFMVDGRYAAALNQDGSYNTAGNPAAPGSIVTVYATGLGPIAPAQQDGSVIALPLPTNALTIGVEETYPLGFYGYGVEAPFAVQYAGPAPTLVAGVSQVNFQVEAFPSFGSIYLYLGPTFTGSTYSNGFLVYIAGE